MDNKLTKEFGTLQKDIAATEAAIAKATASHQTKLAKLRERDTAIRAAIKEAMIANDVKKFENDVVTITLVSASERSGLDVTRIKEEEPDIYERFLKVTPVAASIRIKVK